jgi:hypothetical protein
MNSLAMNPISSCASGKNLAMESFALMKTSSSVERFPPKAEEITSSDMLNAYFAQRLFVLKRLMYPAFQSFTSIEIAPSSWIFPVTGSFLAKNLLKSDSFPSPMTTVQIFGSITRYLRLLS